jgi:hypothetical protein
MWAAVIDGSKDDMEVVSIASKLAVYAKSKLKIYFIVNITRKFPVDKELDKETNIAELRLDEVEAIPSGMKLSYQSEIIQARSKGSAILNITLQSNLESLVVALPENDLLDEKYIQYVIKNAKCKIVLCTNNL